MSFGGTLNQTHNFFVEKMDMWFESDLDYWCSEVDSTQGIIYLILITLILSEPKKCGLKAKLT